MSHRTEPCEQRFSNRQAQVTSAICGAGFAIIGLATAVGDPSSRWFGVVVLLFGASFVFRGLRSADVIVDEFGVRTRSIDHTRRYAFSDLRGVDVAVGRTGMTGFGREYLVFHRFDGRDIKFKELNCRPPKGDESTVVRRAAVCINERLSKH